jgi:hypothetical protein
MEAALGSSSRFRFHLLASQSTADNDEKCEAINGQENEPFNPDGFALVFDQLWPEIQDDNAQAVDDMEKGTEEDEYLEEPVLIDGVDEDPRTRPPSLVGEKGRQNVKCDEDHDTQATNPVQDISQKRAFALISQAFHEANIPFETHLRLLKTMCFRETQPQGF